MPIAAPANASHDSAGDAPTTAQVPSRLRVSASRRQQKARSRHDSKCQLPVNLRFIGFTHSRPYATEAENHYRSLPVAATVEVQRGLAMQDPRSQRIEPAPRHCVRPCSISREGATMPAITEYDPFAAEGERRTRIHIMRGCAASIPFITISASTCGRSAAIATSKRPCATTKSSRLPGGSVPNACRSRR